MRILTVTHFFEAHGGGIERVAGHLCRQFAHLGAAPVWAASDADAAPGTPVEAVPLKCVNPTEKLSGLPMPVPGARSVRTLAQEIRRSDAVVVHDALYVTSILALLIAKGCGKRVVLIQHIAGIPFSSRILRSIMKLANLVVTRPMLWAADERVFISATVRHDLLGTPTRYHCSLLFNGVDASVFYSKAETAPQSGSARADLPPGTRKLLFVGRYVEKKGLNVLRVLAAARPDLTFLLAGSGPIRPTDWGLANVRDLGPQSPLALADLYRSSDLLVLPSVGEGYPLVIQEAMACGLPVICGEPTDRADPEMSDWISGVPIDLADPDGSSQRLAQAIDRSLPSSDSRREMARRALERYDWRVMATKVMALAQGDRAGKLG